MFRRNTSDKIEPKLAEVYGEYAFSLSTIKCEFTRGIHVLLMQIMQVVQMRLPLQKGLKKSTI